LPLPSNSPKPLSFFSPGAKAGTLQAERRLPEENGFLSLGSQGFSRRIKPGPMVGPVRVRQRPENE
jgi:hypothetical protein